MRQYLTYCNSVIPVGVDKTLRLVRLFCVIFDEKRKHIIMYNLVDKTSLWSY